MNYVKYFTINGVNTKQVACIELSGPPNAATEGAVGVLGMDMTSPTHEVYRCVAVNGSVYTWELLSAGMSVISATITGEGGETKAFPYEKLRIPSNYIVKSGDLILDSEGYLYQITSISSDECTACYCGTHIGGIASGDKDCTLVIRDGKLQLVTESGNILSSLDYIISDEDTITRNTKTGVASVRGVKTINDTSLRLFVGTTDEYNALTDEQKQNLFAILTDDTTREDFNAKLNEPKRQVIDFDDTVIDEGDGNINLANMLTLWGKSYTDTIGIGGNVTITLANGLQPARRYFSMLWGSQNSAPPWDRIGESYIFFTSMDVDYVLTLKLTLTEENNLIFASTIRKIGDYNTVSDFTLQVHSLNIYLQ